MKQFNWGILAPGGISQKFASDLKLIPNANLYAVGSRSPERARKFANNFGFQKSYGSYEELAQDEHVDIIYVASPHTGHYKHTLLCLENGKSVLCEKPIAMNAEQFKRMRAKAEEEQVFFMEALWTRFIPSFLKFKELSEDGTIGKMQFIESDFSFKPPFDSEGRLFNKDLGGGSLLDVGIYPVFMALEMAGLPIKMNCMATIGKTGVDEKCVMTLQHKSEILSVLFSSVVNSGRTETLIHGEKGYIRLNSMWHMPTTVDLFLDGKKPKHFSFKEPGFGYQYEAQHAMDCMNAGKIESDVFSWEKSEQLINTLDSIRNQTDIRYSDAIESV